MLKISKYAFLIDNGGVNLYGIYKFIPGEEVAAYEHSDMR